MSTSLSLSAPLPPLPPRVAVLDDDQTILTLLHEILTDAGYEAHTLRAGSGAHEVLRTLAPAAIVLALPAAADPNDAWGWRLLALLARDPALCRIPLLVCVPDDGHASERVTALRHPRSTLLCTPVTLDDLLAHLERLLDRHTGAHATLPPQAHPLRYPCGHPLC